MRYNDKNPQHRKQMEDYLTRGPSQKSLAMQKDLRKNPNLSVNELVKRQTVDTSSLNQLIKKTEENIAFDKKHPPLISTKTMLENGLVDPDEVMVQYDSTTGLFTNKDKTIGFKDAITARKHNEVYEPYSPTVQKLKKSVMPTQASPQQMNYLKNNLDKMKYQNKPTVGELIKKRSLNKRGLNTVVYDGSKQTHKPTYRRGDAKIIIDELERKKRLANPILNIKPIVKPIPDAVKPEPVKPITREELLRNIEEHSKRTKTTNKDMSGIFGTTEYYLRKRGI